MAILYNKPDDGIPNYIYNSLEDAQNDPRFKGIKTHGVTESGRKYTRCYGSAIDVGGKCNTGSQFSWRPILGKIQRDKVAKDLPGERKSYQGILDAWNSYDALSYNKDNVNMIYDRHAGNQELTDETLSKLPLYSMIGTGDARKKYIDPDYEHRRSRHAIIVVGYLKTGEPLIYDLGKISVGIPEKYRGKINYIAAPKNKHYTVFKKQPIKGGVDLAEVVGEKAAKDFNSDTKGGIDTDELLVRNKSKKLKRKLAFQTQQPETNYFGDFLTLLKDTFDI